MSNGPWQPPSKRPNYIGHRAKIGVILPSTNTAVEYDLQKLNIPGVTWHPSRFWVESPVLNCDDAFLFFLELIRKEVPLSIRNVLTSNPSHIMMGMSAETFWGGVEGNQEFLSRVNGQIGDLGLTTGANSCADALNVPRPKYRRSHYQGIETHKLSATSRRLDTRSRMSSDCVVKPQHPSPRH